MTPETPDHEKTQWESVHACPKCEGVVNLADLDLRAITTGIVTCPGCGWTGAVVIQVVGSNKNTN